MGFLFSPQTIFAIQARTAKCCQRGSWTSNVPWPTRAFTSCWAGCCRMLLAILFWKYMSMWWTQSCLACNDLDWKDHTNLTNLADVCDHLIWSCWLYSMFSRFSRVLFRLGSDLQPSVASGVHWSNVKTNSDMPTARPEETSAGAMATVAGDGCGMCPSWKTIR